MFGPFPAGKRTSQKLSILLLVVVVSFQVACGDMEGDSGTTLAAQTTTSATASTTAAPVTTRAATTTTAVPVTQTTLSPEVLMYLEELLAVEVAIKKLVSEVRSVNEAWDNRSETGVSFSESESALETATEQSQGVEEDFNLIEPPGGEGIGEAHQAAGLAVSQMADKTGEMLDGLRAPDTGEARRASLLEFLAAHEIFGEEIDRIVTMLGVSGDRVSGLTEDTVPATDTVETAELVWELAVADEHNGGVSYDRDLYGSWTQVRTGCNTRCVVLEEEQRSDGTWYSWYDGTVVADPSDLDIDHMVPLAEAHSSGGWAWESSRKRQYANDLTHPEALTAVSASSNRSKGSRDPAEWKPPDRSVWCEYATDWITVKTAWDLTADRAEIRALADMLNTCDHSVTFTTVTATTTVTTAVPTTVTTAASVGNSSDCPYTSAAGDPCANIPALGNTSDDVNCGDIPRKYKPLTVTGRDYDRLDRDNNGEACS